MKIFLKFVFLFAVFLIASNRVFGCSPYGYPNPPLQYVVAKTQKIYIGTVISISSTNNRRDNYRYRQIRIKFKVEKALKGVDIEIQEITLEVPFKKHRTSCYRQPPDFKKGEQWIIEDSTSQVPNVQYLLVGFIGKYGNYSKYSFERNGQYIEQLEKVIKNPTTAIYGDIHTFRSWYFIKDAEVTAESNGVKLSTKTGEYGDYSFENLPAGDYKVKIRLPYRTNDYFHNRAPVFDEQTQAYYLEYEVSLKSGDSDYYFAVVTDNK